MGASAPGKPSPPACPCGRARRRGRWPPPAPRPRAAAQRGCRAPRTAAAASAPWQPGPARSSATPVCPERLLAGAPALDADCPTPCAGRCMTTPRRGLAGQSPAPRVGCGRGPRSLRVQREPGWPGPLRSPDAAPRNAWHGCGAHAVRQGGAKEGRAQRACPRQAEVDGGESAGPRTTPRDGASRSAAGARRLRGHAMSRLPTSRRRALRSRSQALVVAGVGAAWTNRSRSRGPRASKPASRLTRGAKVVVNRVVVGVGGLSKGLRVGVKAYVSTIAPKVPLLSNLLCPLPVLAAGKSAITPGWDEGKHDGITRDCGKHRGGNGRLSQTVQLMPGVSPSRDTPGAPSIRVHSVNGLLATDS
jgi:hypothetical protein